MQKRLDFCTHRTYTGAGATLYSRRRTTTGAPAPKIPKSQAISRNNWCRVSRETSAPLKIIPEIKERSSPDSYIGDDRINEIS